MRGCVVALVLLLLVGAFLAGLAYIQLAQAPVQAAGVTPVPVSSAAAQRFDQKIATASGASGPVTIEIDEQEATSKLVEALATKPNAPRLDNPQVTFRDGRVHLRGTTRDTPIPINVLVVGRVEARDGRLVSEVERIDTGRFPLPGLLKDQIAEAATNVEQLNRGLPLYVTDVRVLDGRLAVTGRPK